MTAVDPPPEPDPRDPEATPWHRRSGFILALAIAAVLLVIWVFMLITGGDDEADPAPSPTVTPATTEPTAPATDPTADPTTDPDPDATAPMDPGAAPSTPGEPTGDEVADDAEVPEPIELEGDGDAESEPFTLDGDLTVVRVRSDGDGPLRVELVPEGGDPVEVVQTDGAYVGERVVEVEAGDHRLRVSAPGPWQAVIEQPRVDAAEAPPLQFEGLGDALAGAVDTTAGEIALTWSTDGTGLVVQVFTAGGDLVGEVGDAAEDSGTLEAEAGIHVLAVRADLDATWTLDVE